MTNSSDQPETAELTWQLLQALLSESPTGRKILDVLAEDSAAGILDLAEFLRSDAAPPGIANYVSGGSVEKLVNIARANTVTFYTSATPLTKEYITDRLVLGFNTVALRMLLAAYDVRPDRYEYPAYELAEFVSTINETFGSSLDPPAVPLGAGSFVGYFMQRLRPRDPIGAAIFRVGGELSYWWQIKGLHGDDVDRLLDSNVRESLEELEELRPKATAAVQAVVSDFRGTDTTEPNDSRTRQFIARISTAIASGA